VGQIGVNRHSSESSLSQSASAVSSVFMLAS